MKIRYTLFLIIMLISSIMGAQENQLDDRDPVAMIKASIIFQFAYQSEWPESSLSSSDFIIGVYNNESIYNNLIEKYATQPIGNQILKIKKINNLEDCSTVQILFVDKSKKQEIKKIKQVIGSKSIMLISDIDQALENGALVGFVVVDSKTKYRLDEKEAKKKQIIIGNMLKEWAVK